MTSTPRKIWSLFARSDRRKAVFVLVLIVLMAGAETVGVMSIMPFLSVIANPEVVHERTWLLRAYEFSGLQSTQAFAVALGLASMSVVILSSAFKTVTLHLVNRFVHFQRHTLSTRLLSRYLHQPYEFFLRRNPSLLTKNVLSEVDQLTLDLLQPLSMLIAQGTVVLAIATLIVAYDPWMALGIVVAITMLYGFIYLLVRQRLARIGRERQGANAGRFIACNEAFGGIKEIKATLSADAWLRAFALNSREYSRHSATAETLSASPLYIVEAVGYSGLILISLLLLMSSDDISQVLPSLGLYGFAAYRLLPAVQIMYRGMTKLRFSSAALANVHSDLALPDEPFLAPNEPLQPHKSIRLQGIRYAYPTGPNRPVLDGINLTIKTNTSMGITGASGAGKSTLMDILLGLIPPDAGDLLIDDTPVTTTNRANWQRAIGYVPQQIHLTDSSVAQNIAFGIHPEHIDMGAVRRAASTAQIDQFVTSELPDGYQTKVGDRGIRLSGGQRQRIGIARALYRDPPVLLMDEATSALDAQTEQAFNEAIRALAGSKTIVVIAHKESSLRYCDRVVALGEMLDNEK